MVLDGQRLEVAEWIVVVAGLRAAPADRHPLGPDPRPALDRVVRLRILRESDERRRRPIGRLHGEQPRLDIRAFDRVLEDDRAHPAGARRLQVRRPGTLRIEATVARRPGAAARLALARVGLVGRAVAVVVDAVAALGDWRAGRLTRGRRGRTRQGRIRRHGARRGLGAAARPAGAAGAAVVDADAACERERKGREPPLHSSIGPPRDRARKGGAGRSVVGFFARDWRLAQSARGRA